jgi:hypothetical protein
VEAFFSFVCLVYFVVEKFLQHGQAACAFADKASRTSARNPLQADATSDSPAQPFRKTASAPVLLSIWRERN